MNKFVDMAKFTIGFIAMVLIFGIVIYTVVFLVLLIAWFTFSNYPTITITSVYVIFLWVIGSRFR